MTFAELKAEAIFHRPAIGEMIQILKAGYEPPGPFLARVDRVDADGTVHAAVALLGSPGAQTMDAFGPGEWAFANDAREVVLR